MLLPLLEQLRVTRPAGRPRTRPDAVLGDKAYSSRAIRTHLRTRGIKTVIPEPADQQGHRKRRGSHGGRPGGLDAAAHKGRNVIERQYAQLKPRQARLKPTTPRSRTSSELPAATAMQITTNRLFS
ncbi:Mobile element protein [Arthrobacter sp. DR-2P]|nr:Mobile element protein [Arthrobacter sp. DR-2P]